MTNFDIIPKTTPATNAVTYGAFIFILSIIFAILIYCLFLKPNNEDKFTGFTKKLYDFLSFKTMSLEVIIKVLYLFGAIFITITSLRLISVNFFSFLITLIVGNIVVRIVAEWALLFLLIYKNTKDIRDNTKSKK